MTQPSLWSALMETCNPIETLQQGLAVLETVGMSARDLAERTRVEYANDLSQLIAYLEGRGVTRLDEVGLRELEGYRAEMDTRGYKPSSRDAAIIELFLQTGMRLKTHEIQLPRRITRDPDNTGLVRVTRKGGKSDTIPLNYKACQALRIGGLAIRRGCGEDGDVQRRVPDDKG